MKSDFANANFYVFGDLTPRSAKASRAVAQMVVNGNVENAFIGVGFDAAGVGSNGDVSVNSIMVKGNWAGSSLAVGVVDSSADGFGRNDSALPNSIESTIAKLTILGIATGSPADGDHFGITAERIAKATIFGTKQSLKNGPDDLLGQTNDFRLVDFA